MPPGLPGTFKPCLREVTALPTWTYCFLAYLALQTDDQKVKDQLAYARLIIREAQRHSGSGWLDYDRVFRQQAALDPALKWNSLHPGIQASTLVGQVANAHMLCRLCREPDHSANQCALWYLQPPTSNSGVPGSSSNSDFLGGVKTQELTCACLGTAGDESKSVQAYLFNMPTTTYGTGL